VTPVRYGAVRYGAVRYGASLASGALDGLTRLELAGIRGPNESERAAAVAAAKQAALRLCPDWEIADLEILRRQHAGPVLRVAGRVTDVQVSVAHADGLAVAALCWTEAGRWTGAGA
jgi:hypothetical protein